MCARTQANKKAKRKKKNKEVEKSGTPIREADIHLERRGGGLGRLAPLHAALQVQHVLRT